MQVAVRVGAAELGEAANHGLVATAAGWSCLAHHCTVCPHFDCALSIHCSEGSSPWETSASVCPPAGFSVAAFGVVVALGVLVGVAVRGPPRLANKLGSCGVHRRKCLRDYMWSRIFDLSCCLASDCLSLSALRMAEQGATTGMQLGHFHWGAVSPPGISTRFCQRTI